VRMRRLLVLAVTLFGATETIAQELPPCRIFCAAEFKVEPTLTFTNLLGSPQILADDGTVTREGRGKDFELILSVGLPARPTWLELTVEAIFLPFDRESTPELEFEANFIWLAAGRTRGWVTSHFDVVDKFSAAERPGDRRAYTHKLNLELDTAVALFNRLREGRWLKGVELEGSLDYVATGLPRAGERLNGGRLLDRAGAWSFSVVLVLPIAPWV
jgi:hypothetical protein